MQENDVKLNFQKKNEFSELKKNFILITGHISIWTSIQFEQVFLRLCGKNCNYLTSVKKVTLEHVVTMAIAL